MRFFGMKAKVKILVLTDHSDHSSENSVYALLETLVRHPQVESVWIASRGNPKNKSFFYDYDLTKLYGFQLGMHFEFEASGRQFIENNKELDFSEFNALFLRLPRPIPEGFFDFLSAQSKGKAVINHPKGIEKTGSKEYLLNFPDACPPMQLCRSKEEVLAFAKNQTIVLKPLEEYGGKGIVKIEGQKVYANDDVISLEVYLDSLESLLEEKGMLAMRFLKNVDKGDKRILVVDGQIMAASLRLPPKDSWLCNVAQGGTSVPSQPTIEEEKIIEHIAPKLKEEGIFIFGADTLEDDNEKRVLSEINTLSIGGFPQAEKQTGKPIIKNTIDLMVTFIQKILSERDQKN